MPKEHAKPFNAACEHGPSEGRWHRPHRWALFGDVSHRAVAAHEAGYALLPNPHPAAMTPGEAALELNVPLRIIKDFIVCGSLQLHEDGLIRAEVLLLKEHRHAQFRAALDELEGLVNDSGMD